MWFSVSLLFESIIGENDDSQPLFELSVRLVNAESEEEAERKGIEFGQIDQVSYKNEDDQEVRWRFSEVLDVTDLCEMKLADGVEVFSRLSWSADELRGKGQTGEAGAQL